MGKATGRGSEMKVHGRSMGSSKTNNLTQGNPGRAAAPVRADAATSKAIVKTNSKGAVTLAKKISADKQKAIKALTNISRPKSII